MKRLRTLLCGITALLYTAIIAGLAVELNPDLNQPIMPAERYDKPYFFHSTRVNQGVFADQAQERFRQIFNLPDTSFRLLSEDPFTKAELEEYIMQDRRLPRLLDLGVVAKGGGSTMLALPLDRVESQAGAYSFALLSAHKPFRRSPYDQAPHLHIRGYAKVFNVGNAWDTEASAKQWLVDATNRGHAVSIEDVFHRLSNVRYKGLDR